MSQTPHLSDDRAADLLAVRNLTKNFKLRRNWRRSSAGQVRAVNSVSFAIRRGETLGLVGESGCGKSTLARLLLRLVEPTDGNIILEGVDLTTLNGPQMRQHRRRLQLIFQDPYSSLNPRLCAGAAVEEPLINFKLGSRNERHDRVVHLFERVGLQRDQMKHYPHEFSGGQRQRLGVARALGANPDMIVCDEPVSALDVSIQAQVINLLVDLQRELNLTYLFIAHNLAVVRHISHRTAVMYLGHIVEIGETSQVFSNPLHPYTEALLASVPVPDPRQRKPAYVLSGDVPSPIDPPSGCPFHTRCRHAEARCSVERPILRSINAQHQVACHLHQEATINVERAAPVQASDGAHHVQR